MIVRDENLYPKEWKSTSSTAADGYLTEKKFYGVHASEQTETNWLFKWNMTNIEGTEEYDVDVIINN